MQEHSLELPIAGPTGMLGNSCSFDEANLMPSAQHPQKFYSRRQIFKFLNIFLTWLNVADKNKLYILNHNPLHTFLSKQQKKVVPKFVSAIVSVVVSQSILDFKTQLSFPNGCVFKRYCHLDKEWTKRILLFAHFSVSMGFKGGAVWPCSWWTENSAYLGESNVFNYLIHAHSNLTSSEERGRQNPKYCLVKIHRVFSEENTLSTKVWECVLFFYSFCI